MCYGSSRKLTHFVIGDIWGKRYLGEEHFTQGEQGEQRPRGGMYLGILMPVDWARVSQGDLW